MSRNFVSGSAKRNADAPAIGIVQRMLHATALSSFNDGVRRYEKFIDQARSTRYNAYLLAHTTAGAPTIREKELRLTLFLRTSPDPYPRGRSQGDDRSANAFRALARIKRFLRRACRRICQSALHLAFPTS
jgi:hypothetical protein